MAGQDVRYFSETWMTRIMRVVTAAERDNGPGLRPRRGIIGGDSVCDSQNAVWQIAMLGNPTGGTLTLSITIAGVSANVDLLWNDTIALIQSKLIAGHSKIHSTSTPNIDVQGGGFPNSTISIQFIGELASRDVPLPTANWQNVTGGAGVGVVLSLAQKGHT
jgi:hypothetical protein